LPIRAVAASIIEVFSHIIEPVAPDAIQSARRMLFLDALRAFASVMILLHHFALYPPLSANAGPVLGPLVHWFHDYARFTQVFFVVGGYVMARKMAARSWCLPEAGRFLIRRYCRLGIPYLAAIVLAITACEFGRGWLPDHVVGTPPTVPQFVAHVFFLQELLGYENLSAGIWFVCINFQLGLIYVIMLFLRDTFPRWFGKTLDVPMVAGWALSLLSLFFFNRNPDWDSWAIYFFPYFFMGLVIHRALRNKRSEAGFWLYLLMIVLAMMFDWRWRPIITALVGLLLFGVIKTGLAARWPKSRLIARMGRASYSLFLVHFPVLIIVSTVWERLGWISPSAAVAGLLVAFTASVAASFAFHHYIELSAAGLSRRWDHLKQPDDAPAAVIGSHLGAPTEPG
jgi:peptidoglycan/LPS O-acetylase OafA/YrhL